MPIPVANFTVVPVLLSTAFTDTSTNTPTSWSWDFGDGQNSTLQNPTHVYSTAGTYAVTLTASNTDGSNSIIKALTLVATPLLPTANFTFIPTGLSVAITDTSINTPTSWAWDFGDGQTSTIQNPTVTYATAGIFTIKLVTTNLYGTSTKKRTIVVALTPVLPISLSEFINCKLPSNLVIDDECKDAYIAQWQLFIRPLVSPTIAEAETFNESYYPPLYNALIASLVAYSIVRDEAAKGFTALVTGSNSSSGGGSSSSTSQGGLKTVKTGPSEVSFYDAGSTATNFFKSNSGLAYNAGGPLGTLLTEACTLAGRLRINIPGICPLIKAQPHLFIKSGRPDLPYVTGSLPNYEALNIVF